MQNLSHIPAHNKSLRISPPIASCPLCGQLVKRHETKTCYFWQANLFETTILQLQFGYYICPFCPKEERGFSLLPSNFRTSCQYDLFTQRLILDLMPGMTNRAAIAYISNHFHLPDLHETTIQRWSIQYAEKREKDELYRQNMRRNFSGQMTIDEMYDDGWCIIRVTDPLQNVELKWVLLDRAPNTNDIEKLLTELKVEGFRPQIINTDGSILYPEPIAKIFSEARHQRCVFHFIKHLFKKLNKVFFDFYQTMPRPPKRKRGRVAKRYKKRHQKEKKMKENRSVVRRSRWLLFKKESNMTSIEKESLEVTLQLCPALEVFRDMICAILSLFDSSKTPEEAEEKRAALCASEAFQSHEGFSAILKKLGDMNVFDKLTAYLHFENAVKTTNHVEGENRSYRQRQKSRYRFRSKKSIIALLIHLHYRKRSLPSSLKKPFIVKSHHSVPSGTDSPSTLELLEVGVKNVA